MAVFWVLGLAFAGASETASGVELFADPRFERGFILSGERSSATPNEIGVLEVGGSASAGPPAWRLAQWGSRYLLQPGRCAALEGERWEAENVGKRVAVDRGDGGMVSVLLDAHGIAEYGGHLRAQGESWPHLLVEQAFPATIRMNELAGLTFRLEMRLDHCQLDPAAQEKVDPGLHTAQISAYWTVHNLTQGNEDYRDMIWLGIPLYDARYVVPPSHFAIDTGQADASGKFICVFDGKRFWTAPTGDGSWHILDTDLMALLREGLEISQKHGHLKHTTMDDLAITTFNLGWELPGPYDAAIELRGLSMKGVRK